MADEQAARRPTLGPRTRVPLYDATTMTLDDDEDEDGMVVDEWLVARCKLLPKKGI